MGSYGSLDSESLLGGAWVPGCMNRSYVGYVVSCCLVHLFSAS